MKDFRRYRQEYGILDHYDFYSLWRINPVDTETGNVLCNHHRQARAPQIGSRITCRSQGCPGLRAGWLVRGAIVSAVEALYLNFNGIRISRLTRSAGGNMRFEQSGMEECRDKISRSMKRML